MDGRRLPIYILVDTSGYMDGGPIEGVTDAVQELVDDLRKDPQALDSAWLSIITVAHEAQQVVPLMPLSDIHVPMFSCGGIADMDVAIDCLHECFERDGCHQVQGYKGNNRPVVIFLTNNDGRGEVGDKWGSLDGHAVVREISRVAGVAVCFIGEKSGVSIRGFKSANFVIAEQYAGEIEAAMLDLKNMLFHHEDRYISFCLPSCVKESQIAQCLFSKVDESSDWVVPVYFLIDASAFTTPQQVEHVREQLMDFLEDVSFRSEDGLMDALRLSIVLCREKTDLITALGDWRPYVPRFNGGGRLRLAAAIDLLCTCWVKDEDGKVSHHEFPPLIFLVSKRLKCVDDESELRSSIVRLRSHKLHRFVGCYFHDDHDGDQADIESFVSCGCDLVVDFRKLKSCFNDLLSDRLLTKDIENGVLCSVAMTSFHDGKGDN